MDIRPDSDPTPTTVPWELRDVTHTLVRALKTDLPPYQKLDLELRRYVARARRLGQTPADMLVTLERLAVDHAVTRVEPSERGALLDWIQGRTFLAYYRGD